MRSGQSRVGSFDFYFDYAVLTVGEIDRQIHTVPGHEAVLDKDIFFSGFTQAQHTRVLGDVFFQIAVSLAFSSGTVLLPKIGFRDFSIQILWNVLRPQVSAAFQQTFKHCSVPRAL